METQSQKIICKNCLIKIPKQNYKIHSMRCKIKKHKQQKNQILQQEHDQKQKKNKRIPFKKQMQNSTKINQKYQNEEKIPCTFCGYFQTLAELDTHYISCPGQCSNCEFCDQKYPNQILSEHENVCQKNPNKQQSNERQQQRGSLQINLRRILEMLEAISSLMGQWGFQQQQNGLSKEQLKKLKRINYIRDKESDLCTICYCQFQEKEQIVQLKCKHYFHFDCIQKWLQKNSRCPNCKKDQKS